jgi:hypothetical protein
VVPKPVSSMTTTKKPTSILIPLSRKDSSHEKNDLKLMKKLKE